MNQTEDRPNPILIHDMLLAWQMPALLLCDWWSTALQSFGHDYRPAQPPGEQDEAQLVVPEPIEEEGEHALFA
jgi:hypothetical protein